MSADVERRVALFGYPLGHSVSPAMHHAAAAALGLRLHYEPWPLQPAELPAAVRALRDEPWLGANVTLPHKPAAVGLVDGVSPLVGRIGALNTIYKRAGRLCGENTDAPALLRCLRLQLDFQPARERVLVLGAGGAARAALVALADAGVADLAVWNRTPERAAALLAELRAAAGLDARLKTVDPGSSLADALQAATLVVNATSAGLDGAAVPLEVDLLPREARVFDMVYGPQGTPLVRRARERDLRAVDGLWMLVYQAAASFLLWTGRQPPEETMHDAALASLRHRAAVRADQERAS